MEFKTGDNVVHPSHGVGRIVGLEERELGASGCAGTMYWPSAHKHDLDASTS